MSHPFGDNLTGFLHRKHGLSQAKLADGIDQPPGVISQMCRGKRLTGPLARERVVRIIGWLRAQGVPITVNEANALLAAAGMAALDAQRPAEADLLRRLATPIPIPPPPLPSPPPPDEEPTRSRHKLPLLVSSFVGRAAEMAEFRQMLAEYRLLTLVGPGGCGKTRLALEVAREQERNFADGVWFIDLAEIAPKEAALVPQIIERVLGLSGRSEQTDASPQRMHIEDVLIDALKHRHALLVLDNCEHIPDVCTALAERIHENCPKIWLLATSRDILYVARKEIPYLRLNSLSVPDMRHSATLEDVTRFEAMQLFRDRVQTQVPGFAITEQNVATVAQICHQLDGIPLAIELAAACLSFLPLRVLATHLNDLFDPRPAGSSQTARRHETLETLIDWSYEQLSEGEIYVFRCISVFRGDWTFESAEAVCKTDKFASRSVLAALSKLANKSLIEVHRQDGDPHYHLLEIIREYAQAKLLETGTIEEVRQRHLTWYVSFAERASAKLHDPDQMQYLNSLELEHSNLRLALAWGQESGQFEEGGRIGAALGPFWAIRGGYLSEGRALLDELLARQDALAPLTTARLLAEASRLITLQGDFERAITLAQESLARWRELKDSSGIAATLIILGRAVRLRGATVLAEADEYFQESWELYKERWELYRLDQDQLGIANALHNLGNNASSRGDLGAAIHHYQESLALRDGIKDLGGMAFSLYTLGDAYGDQGEYGRAEPLLLESYKYREQLADTWGMRASLMRLGDIAQRQGNYAEAESYYSRSLSLSKELGNKVIIARLLGCLAQAASLQGNLTQAQSWYTQSMTLWQELSGMQIGPVLRHNLGYLGQSQGDLEVARVVFTQCLQLAGEHAVEQQETLVWALAGLATVALVQQQSERAARLGGAAAASPPTLRARMGALNREIYELMLDKLHEQIVAANLDALWEQGARLPLAAAIQNALGTEKHVNSESMEVYVIL